MLRPAASPAEPRLSPVSHVGLFLIGLALLEGRASPAMTLFVVADGFIRGCPVRLPWAPFSTCTAASTSCGCSGRARAMRISGPVVAAARPPIASLPPLGPLGWKPLIEEGPCTPGAEWITLVIVLSSMLTGAAASAAARTLRAGSARRTWPIVDAPAPEEVDFELDFHATGCRSR